MADELFDAEEFAAQLPVWAIIDEAKFHQHGLIPSIVSLTAQDVGRFVPLFTDLDLAKQAIADLGVPGKVPLILKTLKAVRVVMTDLESVGCEHVGIDLWKNRVRFYPVREIIDAAGD